MQRRREIDNANPLNFTSRMATPICTGRHTKRAKSDATIFKSQIGEVSLDFNFIPGQALPLGSTRFFRLAHISPVIQRRPARQSCAGRAMTRRTAGEMSRSAVAPWPGSDRAVAEQLSSDGRRDNSRDNLLMDANPTGSDRAISGKATRKLVRQQSGRNRAIFKPVSHELTYKNLVIVFNHYIQRL